MNQEQLDVLNTVQEVLRMVTVSMCALNPEAMPRVAHALRAASADQKVSPMACAMLDDLAKGVELFSGQTAKH